LTLLVGQQEGHPVCKKLSGGVLAWLFAVHGPMVWNSLPDDLRAQQDYE